MPFKSDKQRNAVMAKLSMIQNKFNLPKERLILTPEKEGDERLILVSTDAKKSTPIMERSLLTSKPSRPRVHIGTVVLTQKNKLFTFPDQKRFIKR